MSAQSTLLWHLRELQGVYDALDSKSPAKERIAARVQECKDALKVLDKKRL